MKLELNEQNMKGGTKINTYRLKSSQMKCSCETQIVTVTEEVRYKK